MPDFGISESLIASGLMTGAEIDSIAAIGSTISTIASTAMGAASAIGTLKSANAARAEGKAQQQANDFASAQLKQQANDAAASGERAAISQARQTKIAESNAVAASGASGTSGSQTVNNNLAIIGDEGSYRTQTAMYNGLSKQQSLNTQASGQTYQGNISRVAGNTKATTTLISGASSLFQKYGSFPSSSENNDTAYAW